MPKFVPRQRKPNAHARQKGLGGHGAPNLDTNAAELLPASKAEKEMRRQQLKEELQRQHRNISGKKKKRLDKYIVRNHEACHNMPS